MKGQSVASGAAAPRLLVSLGYSLLAHTLLALMLFAIMGWQQSERPPEHVLITSMVRLGPKRDPNLLPQKETVPPPPPPAAAAPEPAPSPKAEPATATAMAAPTSKAQPSRQAQQSAAQQRLAQLGRVDKMQQRLRELAGEADGSAEGSSDTAVEGNAYLTLVHACISQHYVIEGTDPALLRTKEVTVVVHIDADGRFSRYRVEGSSGVASFDQAVLRAVQRCGRVSPPPAALRKRVFREGLEVVYTPN